MMDRRTQLLGLCFAILTSIAAIPAAAQTDFSGEWRSHSNEDQPDRIPGPELGDYTGLPINAAARQKAESWDASLLSNPERQAQPHPAQYFMYGPRPDVRIEKVVDPATGDLIAYRLGGTFGRADRIIWLDGRPHPSEYAEHRWAGFSTGEYDGDDLVITTTHMKYGVIRRNGVPSSPRATMTERWIRYGDRMMIVMYVDDPVYLEEPLLRTNTFVLSPYQHTEIAVPFEIVDEIIGRKAGDVQHYPLGTEHHTLADTVGLPFEVTRGGAETMYPEYQQHIEALMRDSERGRGGRR